MRAAMYNLVAQTGADLRRAFAACTPDATLVPARVVKAYDWIYFRDCPTQVYSATLNPNPDPALETVSFVFGAGAWFDPRATIGADDLVIPVRTEDVTVAEAGFTLYSPNPDPTLCDVVETKVDLPVSIVDGQVQLYVPANTTLGWGDMEGAWSWDLYGETATWGWQRLVEGTLAIVKGSGRVPATP